MCRKSAKSAPKICRKGANNSKFAIEKRTKCNYRAFKRTKNAQKKHRSVLEASLGEKVAKVGKTI